MKKFQMFASAVLCCTLAACGGDGGGDDAASGASATATTDTTVVAGTNTGSVSASFARSSAARYFILTASSQTVGVLNTSVQDGNGVMTTLNDSTLSGTSVTKEISGDANLAQGRWVAGTVTNGSGARTLTGADDQSVHYVAFNNLPAMPTTGTAACATGSFTAPTRTSASGADTATATGTASIAFGSTTATVTGTITAVADGSTGSVSLDTNVASTSSVGMTGSYLNGGPGAGVALATDGGTGYVVVAAYTARLVNGNQYRGVANFHCN